MCNQCHRLCTTEKGTSKAFNNKRHECLNQSHFIRLLIYKGAYLKMRWVVNLLTNKMCDEFLPL